MNVNNKDFKNTLNLPKKVFNMYASLELRTKFYTDKLLLSDNYKKSLENNSDSKQKVYVSEIPLVLDNKLTNNDLLYNILRDIVIRYSLMSNKITETNLLFSYINKIEDKKVSMKDIINNEIKILNKTGSIIDFSNIYKTTKNTEFVHKMYDTFYKLYKEDKIYIQDAPINNCFKCKNVLIKKQRINTPNYYMLFKVVEDNKYLLAEYNNLNNTYIVASTIRPWTLIKCENIAVQRNSKYSIVEFKSVYGIISHYIIESNYVEEYMANSLIFDYEIKKTITGEVLKDLVFQNVIDSSITVKCLNTELDLSKIGVGSITITPAHSYLEYLIYKENGLNEVKNYIDLDGKFYSFFNEYKFKYYKDVEKEIIDILKKSDRLLYIGDEKINTYKCGNCSNELVYRYSSQIYINENKEYSDNDIKLLLGKTSMNINIPIRSNKYLEISNNTNIGVNIPAVTCLDCSSKIINERIINKYKEKVQKYGIEEVNKMTPEKLLDGEVLCKCGGMFFFKLENMFNNTFEIISSDLTSNDINFEEVDNIYISNIDNFIKTINIIKYNEDFNNKLKSIKNFFVFGNIKENKKVLGVPEYFIQDDIEKYKHDEGFIVTNIGIEDIINKYGPDILRLWALHRCSDKKIIIEENKLKYEEKIYTNIRKTISFIISNIQDFNYKRHYIDINNRTDLDKYMIIKINELRHKLISCYNNLNLYQAYIYIKDFCFDMLCDKYFSSIKYNLYILNENSDIRRSTQSTLYDIFKMLNIYLGPIIPYIFLESCSYLGDYKTLINEREQDIIEYNFKEEYEKWENIFNLKSKIQRYISKSQNEKIIGNTLQASLLIKCDKQLSDFLNSNNKDILKTLNVSEIETEISDEFEVIVTKSEAEKCERCNNHRNDVGRHPKYRYACYDCANILESR